MYGDIKIVRGDGRCGGPLIIRPTKDKHKFIYVTDGGGRPMTVDKIEGLTGMESINGLRTSIPDSEIALAIVDRGGTLRCGVYLKKGILTISIVPAGKSSPLARYITEDIYVSAVRLEQIQPLMETDDNKETVNTAFPDKKYKYNTSKKITERKVEQQNWITKIGMGVGKVVATFSQSAREAIDTMIRTVIPSMALASSLIDVIQGPGIGNVFTNIMASLAGNAVGLTIIGFICSLSLLSPLLNPGAIISQVIGTLIGVETGKGNIPPQLALPALFTISTQGACDFVPVGLGLEETRVETVEVGVPSVLYLRFLNGISRVITTWVASFGLYS